MHRSRKREQGAPYTTAQIATLLRGTQCFAAICGFAGAALLNIFIYWVAYGCRAVTGIVLNRALTQHPCRRAAHTGRGGACCGEIFRFIHMQRC